ncbi:hypothetical protein CBL_05106 [Carabus blaptoides fortunei]
MAIRRHVEYDGKKYHGYIDMGTGIEGDDRSVAKETDGVNGEQRANLIKMCLSLCHEAGVGVVSLTFNGAPSNFTMVRKLGCNTDPTTVMKTCFHHPVTQEKNYMFPDPCHMIKLIRNTLGEKGIIFDENNSIKWDYVTKLHHLQEGEGLHLANKVRSTHINYKRQKMKVHLATQVLSTSVATALEICDIHLRMNEFKDSSSTNENGKRTAGTDLTSTSKRYFCNLTTQNRYTISSENENMPSTNQQSRNSTNPPQRKIPPIFLQKANNYQQVLLDIKTILKHENFTTKTSGPQTIKINLNSINDYRMLTHYYDSQKVQFFTFKPPDDKPPLKIRPHLYPQTQNPTPNKHQIKPIQSSLMY